MFTSAASAQAHHPDAEGNCFPSACGTLAIFGEEPFKSEEMNDRPLSWDAFVLFGKASQGFC